MSDLLRLTGMYSGMDTEAIVSAMVSAKAQQVTKLKDEKKKLEWKQTIWQDINKKILGLYKGSLSNMRFSGSYALKNTKVSDSTKATIIAGENATNGTQTLQVNKLAKGGFLTGAKLDKKEVTVTEKAEDGSEVTKTEKRNWKGDDKLNEIATQLGGINLTGSNTVIKIKVGSGAEKEIAIDEYTTISQFVSHLNNAGVKASFDEANQRFFINTTSTGAESDFTLTAVQKDDDGNVINDNYTDVLSALGINENDASGGCTRVHAQDAEIVWNGAVFTNTSNTFSINGYTITASGVTDDELTVTTETDYDGIYDMIKDFITEYNDIINDVYTKYNADSARKYDMLTDEEKEAMSDDEVEKWENTIKDSLLRRDSTVYSIMNILNSTMTASYAAGSKQKHLFDFGIEKLSYAKADVNERWAFHIFGDEEDENTSEEEDELMKAITSDPEGTVEFFTNLSKSLYDNLTEAMSRTDYRSIYTIYNDKTLDKELTNYETKIKEAQEKLEDYEDKWYEKFSAMEVALSKLQSNQSALSGMLGS